MKENKITKAEIVNDIYDTIIERYKKSNKNCHIIKSDVAFIIDQFFESVKNSLIDEYIIEFRGFGTFYLKKRAAKKNSRNPRSGEMVETLEHYIASFKAGMELKNSLKKLGDK